MPRLCADALLNIAVYRYSNNPHLGRKVPDKGMHRALDSLFIHHFSYNQRN